MKACVVPSLQSPVLSTVTWCKCKMARPVAQHPASTARETLLLPSHPLAERATLTQGHLVTQRPCCAARLCTAVVSHHLPVAVVAKHHLLQRTAPAAPDQPAAAAAPGLRQHRQLWLSGVDASPDTLPKDLLCDTCCDELVQRATPWHDTSGEEGGGAEHVPTASIPGACCCNSSNTRHPATPVRHPWAAPRHATT